ncbi:hypothetical protein THI_1783 [Thiomonas arsenitoxydans]|uniref:Uncharacterized protein n=1 Tax=Thiomonas arsenitoxydans (strain DSM 22701 / CIP 110005 / 3As) TaxID=426114 RepID=D6CT36_THIA3|nr:hypothetical protein THI_1783 [Thiomonas arsenitoxydans]
MIEAYIHRNPDQFTYSSPTLNGDRYV